MAENKTPIRDINGHIVADQEARDQAAQNAERISELSEEMAKKPTAYGDFILVQELPETEITVEPIDGYAMAQIDTNIYPTASEEGEIRIIVFDGKEYECAMFITEGHSFGNGALANENIFPDTGEPFLYVYSSEHEFSGVFTGDTSPVTHTIACYKKEGTVHTIDTKYIPSTVPVIHTATVGQTIAVKTVDKNGKPTKWEAVNMGGGDGGADAPCIVTVTGTEGSDGRWSYESDMTLTEIYTAYKAGRQVFANVVDSQGMIRYMCRLRSCGNSLEEGYGAHFNSEIEFLSVNSNVSMYVFEIVIDEVNVQLYRYSFSGNSLDGNQPFTD